MIELAMALALIAPGAPVRDSFWVIAYRSGGDLDRIDPELLRPADAAGDPYAWKLDSGYPAAAKRESSTGSVEIEIRVSSGDKIVGCTVTRPAADSRLNAAACPLITGRGAFRHALARDGSPREGAVTLTVDFYVSSGDTVVEVPPAIRVPGYRSPEPKDEAMLTLPNASTAMFPNRNPVVLVDIDATGNVTNCGIHRSTGTDFGDIRLCEVMRTVPFIPMIKGNRPTAAMAWTLYPTLKP